MRYRTVRTLPPEVAAYIAGLIDGEGSVTLSRRHAKDRRQLVVSIANTDRALLIFVLESVGTGKITAKRISSLAHTPSFCFSIANRQALALLTQLEKHLRTYKKRRALLALEHYVRVTPRNGKYSESLQEQRSQFESEFMAIVGTPNRP